MSAGEGWWWARIKPNSPHAWLINDEWQVVRVTLRPTWSAEHGSYQALFVDSIYDEEGVAGLNDYEFGPQLAVPS